MLIIMKQKAAQESIDKVIDYIKKRGFDAHVSNGELHTVIGAVGGGVLRDVFSREIPAVLKSDFYATASIIGAVIYLVLENFPAIGSGLCFLFSAICVTAIRVYAIRHHLNLPVARMAGEEKRK